MICKNPYCGSINFVAVIETDTKMVIGLKCTNCSARYAIHDIQIEPSLEREGWNSVKWTTKHI